MYVHVNALYTGNYSCVKFLLDNGADIRVRNDMGRSAFMLAVREGHPAIAELLLNYGADVDEVREHAMCSCCVCIRVYYWDRNTHTCVYIHHMVCV